MINSVRGHVHNYCRRSFYISPPFARWHHPYGLLSLSDIEQESHVYSDGFGTIIAKAEGVDRQQRLFTENYSNSSFWRFPHLWPNIIRSYLILIEGFKVRYNMLGLPMFPGC
jgi:hypothetical protein